MYHEIQEKTHYCSHLKDFMRRDMRKVKFGWFIKFLQKVWFRPNKFKPNQISLAHFCG